MMLMKKHWILWSSLFIVGLLIPLEAWSLICYITMAKDNCWQKYNVEVEIINGALNKRVALLNMPVGKNFSREHFDCKPADNFYYVAKFNPPIWNAEEDKKYTSKRYWIIPNDVPSEYVIWQIQACYPADFSQVPMTPYATANCQCDFSGIPAIKPPVLTN